MSRSDTASATRIAAIDCGTNSLRMLVADRPADGSGSGLVDVTRCMEIVRLGEGVDRTGRLSPAAIERTRVVLVGYARTIGELDVDRVRMVATSASRDAQNADDFRAMVRSTLGIDPEVVTGDEEARLSFTGAVRSLGDTYPAPYLVVDIGGGSTEFVTGTRDVDATISVDIGCVRMTERYLHGDPPTPEQVEAAGAFIATEVERALAAVPGKSAATLVGLAGSVTTVAAMALGLPTYDPTRIHRARISYAQVVGVTAQLMAMTVAQRRAVAVMHPGRVDVIAAGALVLRTVMERASIDFVVASEHGILDGIAWSTA